MHACHVFDSFFLSFCHFVVGQPRPKATQIVPGDSEMPSRKIRKRKRKKEKKSNTRFTRPDVQRQPDARQQESRFLFWGVSRVGGYGLLDSPSLTYDIN